PYCPGRGNCKPIPSQACCRNACGTCSKIPAPSPVLSSQPQAPRWSRFCNTVRACCTISCDFSPLMFTTKPIPQASCSKRGSSRPCLWGWLGIVIRLDAVYWLYVYHCREQAVVVG